MAFGRDQDPSSGQCAMDGSQAGEAWRIVVWDQEDPGVIAEPDAEQIEVG